MIKLDINKKALRVFEVHKEIQKLIDEGVRSSTKLDSLLEERVDLERGISNLMIDKKGTLSDPVLDYCFRNFSGSCYRQYKRDPKYTTAITFIPKVKEFIKSVEKMIGEKILSVYEDTPSGPFNDDYSKVETGIIKGPCEFEIERSFRHLYVPVEKRFKLRKNSTRWEENGDKILISDDIFSHPKLSFFQGHNSIWATDHSGEFYVGGPGPGKTTIYLGNKLVEKNLRGYKEREVKESRIEKVTGLNI